MSSIFEVHDPRFRQLFVGSAKLDQLCTGLRLVLANKTNGLKRWTVVRTVERAAADTVSPTVARVAPSCEIQDVDTTAAASQLDDVEIF